MDRAVVRLALRVAEVVAVFGLVGALRPDVLAAMARGSRPAAADAMRALLSVVSLQTIRRWPYPGVQGPFPPPAAPPQPRLRRPASPGR
ncbi:hypothetical protein [Streptomyces sp. NPDC054842]